MNKAQMAHEMAVTMVANGCSLYTAMADAWGYVDAMEEEQQKRKNADREARSKRLRELANKFHELQKSEGDTGLYVTILHDQEFQPDWNQAPEWAKWWALNKDGIANWFDDKPSVSCGYLSFGDALQCDVAPSFNYEGYWENSLRKNPLL